MSWYLGAYQSVGGYNLGIYNCRYIAGTNQLSVHAEGRAADLGVSPLRAAYGDRLAEELRNKSAELGIQRIIYNRRQWAGGEPAWRSRGADHDDHLHVELTQASSVSLTVPIILSILNGVQDPPPPIITEILETDMTLILLPNGAQMAVVPARGTKSVPNSEYANVLRNYADKLISVNLRERDIVVDFFGSAW